ncbi:MAG: acyl-ACP--UDP-N-acetylglucosamine O-acyltransferase [Rickettsiaceae bacterium]
MYEPQIHLTSSVSHEAVICDNVKIGPFCVIGPDVHLGENVELKSHVAIDGRTTIGHNTVIYPFASIGHRPQDLKYKGEESKLRIGSNNIIREYVTIHPGTQGGNMLTQIGDNCLLMIGSHIAHDCIIGDNVILANYVNLAGHVTIGNYTLIGGMSAVLQYVRIGHNAMIGGMSAVANDVIPFGLVSNDRAKLEGLNIVGMKRRDFDKNDTLQALNTLEEIFHGEGYFSDRLESLRLKYSNNQILQQIIEFLKQDSVQSFCPYVKK